MGAFPHRHFAAPLSPGCRIKVPVRGINALWQPPPPCLLHNYRCEYRTGKQTTHIPSNTLPVYFISNAYLYMYATCFGQYVGHLQARQYKKPYKGIYDKNLRGPSHYFNNIKHKT